MTPELQNIIGSIIQQLATWTGQTVETISSNLPHFLKAYGWYYTLHDLHWTFIWSLLGLGIATVILGLLVCCVLVDIIDTDDSFIKVIKTYAKFAIPTWIGLSILNTLIPVITTMVVPEIVGLEALMELIKTVG